MSEKEIKLNFDKLILMRKSKRAAVTRTINTLDTETLDGSGTVFYKNKLISLADDLLTLHEKLGDLALLNALWDETDYEEQTLAVESYNDKIQKKIISLKLLESAASSNGPNKDIDPKFLLPKIELPKFSGTPDSYQRFIESFEALIGKYNLSDYEQYVYLLRQLSGNAKSLIETMSVGDLTYSEAKKLLDKAYCSKLDQQFALIEKLSKLKMTVNSDPYTWICSSRSIVNQIEKSDIDREIFLQYFLWYSLHDGFKSQYVNITNTSKPNLKQIMEHAFEANTRYCDFGDKNIKPKADHKYEDKKSTHAVALATQVLKSTEETKLKVTKGCCILCTYDQSSEASGHRTSQCQKYIDAASKRKKLKSMNHCLKCGYNHPTNECRFKFYNACTLCNKQHFAYLCTESGSSIAVSSEEGKVTHSGHKPKSMKVTEKRTVNQLVQFAIQNEEFEKVVLPTFSMEASSRSNKKLNLKCLLDTASQSSFIIKDLATKMKLDIVQKDITVNIFGFNEARKYVTNLVSLDLYINNKKKTIYAIVVPKIRTSITIPELDMVATEFKNKGHKMADTHLNSDSSNNIQLLLGMDNCDLLSFETVPYGSSERQSIYLKTPLGTVLLGNVNQMVENLSNDSLSA